MHSIPKTNKRRCAKKQSHSSAKAVSILNVLVKGPYKSLQTNYFLAMPSSPFEIYSHSALMCGRVTLIYT